MTARTMDSATDTSAQGSGVDGGPRVISRGADRAAHRPDGANLPMGLPIDPHHLGAREGPAAGGLRPRGVGPAPRAAAGSRLRMRRRGGRRTRGPTVRNGAAPRCSLRRQSRPHERPHELRESASLGVPQRPSDHSCEVPRDPAQGGESGAPSGISAEGPRSGVIELRALWAVWPVEVQVLSGAAGPGVRAFRLVSSLIGSSARRPPPGRCAPNGIRRTAGGDARRQGADDGRGRRPNSGG